MQRIFLIIFTVVFFIVTGCESSEKILNEKEVHIKEGIVYKNNKIAPFTGKLILNDLNINNIFYVKNGKTHGIEYFFYYGSGKIGYLSDYTKDKQDRVFQQYLKNGNLYCERNYKTGSYKEYDNNGNFKLKGFYSTFGSKTGRWKIYEDNQLIIEKNYSKGILEGSYKEYYKNKKLKSKGTFKNGKKQGKWIEYRKNGELFSKEFYKNGKLEGSIKEYYENGNIMSEGVYKTGKQEGYFKNYYLNGKLKSEGNFKEGKAIGIWKFYNKNDVAEELDINE